MGTRSNVRVYDNDGDEILVTLYRQFDGYPTGMGSDIKSILNDGNVTIVNGYGGDQECPTHFNGMGCLAAYLIGQLKGIPDDEPYTRCIGNVYIFPPNHEPGQSWEEYLYDLYIQNDQLYIDVYELRYVEDSEDKKRHVLYTGPLSDFDPESVE